MLETIPVKKEMGVLKIPLAGPGVSMGAHRRAGDTQEGTLPWVLTPSQRDPKP